MVVGSSGCDQKDSIDWSSPVFQQFPLGVSKNLGGYGETTSQLPGPLRMSHLVWLDAKCRRHTSKAAAQPARG